MKLLNGADLADFIKERQAKQVRALRQAWHTAPKLAIIQTIDSPVIDAYVRLKRAYSEDVLVDVEHHKVTEDEAVELIGRLNDDDSVHGIIVQLPLSDVGRTDELVNLVTPEKDVDALGENAVLDPATPVAISWLLAGYNVELRNRKIVIVGQGRLVGAPLAKMWRSSGYDITVVDGPNDHLAEIVHQADIIVSATGVPGIITSDMIAPETVVVDAGTASEGGKIVGDIAVDVRELRNDLKITPEKGGVGPLTIAALFDNVIRAARRVATLRDQASS
ncbi:bifunctional 5,10-methylenetetrahydrofolate dehydrogenase/5,10-methenyltetrahydrofolate cyclohydrolase [Patescibacteria group bacterium]|nr:MAG: bifunctional 5,10-methylenetetrahydrofolate dehydrogenase/5,10-methenyltetrahydrofolate cyclohydrolase [Patescibacteria group bacterium]